MSPHADLITAMAYALFAGAAIVSLWWAVLVWELSKIRNEMRLWYALQATQAKRPRRR